MFSLVASQRFKKNLRRFLRKHLDLGEIVQCALEMLCKNPRDARLRTHKLSGRLKHCFGASLAYDARLVFAIDGDRILLLAIGNHDEVY